MAFALKPGVHQKEIVLTVIEQNHYQCEIVTTDVGLALHTI